ncbi:MAG: DUF309 domain-containing protein [Gammaproteobacteria bacterium]|nr:DUF309 domain-containing protein [Gammaproteobacteria bacterium]
MPPDNREQKPPRYSDRPFPPYRYVPGQAPHPTRDPDGHSFNEPVKQPGPFDASQWQNCEEYLYGIDLFNHGYWWEAHEALESVWVAAGRTTETGQFLQGLIQISVAQLKDHQGFSDVCVRMARDGLDKMKWIQGHYLGIDVPRFREEVESYISTAKRKPLLITLDTSCTN